MKLPFAFCFAWFVGTTAWCQQVYPWFDGTKWGLTNSAREVLLPPQIDEEFPFYPDRAAAVKVNGKWGILDPRGSFRVKPVYDKIETLDDVYGYATLNGKRLILNKNTGQESGKAYAAVKDYCYCAEGLFVVTANNKDAVFSAVTGKLITKPLYDEVKFTFETRTVAIVTIGKKKGVVDLKTGKQVIPISFDEVEETPYSVAGKYFQGFRAQAAGADTFFSNEGVVQNIDPGSGDGLVEMVAPEEEQSGVVPKKVYVYGPVAGEWKITVENRSYGSTEIFESYSVTGYDKVEKDPDMWYPEASKEFLRVYSNGKVGFISASGKVAFEPMFDAVRGKDGRYFITTVNGLVGVLTREMKEISKPELKEVERYNYQLEGWLVALPDGRRGYLLMSGKIMIPGLTD